MTYCTGILGPSLVFLYLFSATSNPSSLLIFLVPTYAAQAGKLISVDLHTDYVYGPKICKSYFIDQLTFSNTCGRLVIKFMD